MFIVRRVALLRQLWTKINMFSGDENRVCRSKKPAALQSKVAGQIGELFVQDVVISELFLLSVDV